MRKFSLSALLAPAVLSALLVVPGATTSYISVAQDEHPKPAANCHSANAGVTDENQAADAINRFSGKMRGEGASDAAIDRALANKFCLENITQRPAQQMENVASTGDDITLGAPNIYYDSQSYRYYTIATWKWRNEDYGGDVTSCGFCEKNIGGTDGAGTAYSTTVFIRGQSLYWAFGQCSGSWSKTTADDINGYGVGMSAQDTYNRTCDGKSTLQADNRMYRGQQTVSFRGNFSSCRNVQAYFKYGHSWNSTSVNSFGIGPMSISFGWNTTSNQWTRAIQGNVATVCP